MFRIQSDMQYSHLSLFSFFFIFQAKPICDKKKSLCNYMLRYPDHLHRHRTLMNTVWRYLFIRKGFVQSVLLMTLILSLVSGSFPKEVLQEPFQEVR